MKLGFLSSIVPELSFEEVIDFASGHGFSCVEMACWPGGGAERRYAGTSHIDMESLDDAKAAHVKSYLEQKNVFISAIGYYPNPLSADPEKRDAAIRHIKACIDGAKKLGVGLVNTFIGRNRLADMEQNMRDFDQVWPDIIAYAAERKVKIGIENCPMYFWDEWPNGDNLACSPHFWKEMFTRIPSDYFGLNYDPSHLIWQRMDYLKPVKDFSEKLFHIHIKDAAFYPDLYDEAGIFAPPLTYHAPKLPGQGDINWGKFIAALNDAGYQGACILEIEDRAYEGTLEDKLDSILLSRDYMRNYIRG